MVCASLPAVRQLLLMILPSLSQTLPTSRARRQSVPGQNRSQTPSLQRQRKGRSVFRVPSFSEPGKNLYSATTDFSTSSWAKPQAEIVQDIERGHVIKEEPESRVWNPPRTLLSREPRSFQTPFWSSVNRSGSPPSRGEPTRRPNATGFQAMVTRTEVAETTGEANSDEQVELLQVPGNSYQSSRPRDSEYDDLTALPRIGGLPDDRYPSPGLSQWFRY